MTHSPLFSSRADRETNRLGRRAGVLSVIANSLAIAAPVIAILGGVWVTNLNSDVADLNATIDELNGDVATANAQLDVRQETIKELREENSDLRAALPPSIAAEDIPDARNSGRVTLASGGDAIDLNSTLPNFDAGVTSWTPDTLTYRRGVLSVPFEVSVLHLDSGEASYETCAVATGYAPTRSIEPHRLTDGQVCTRMGSGRYAKITVESYDADRVILAIMTWEKPF